jgi:hypothetical protein
MTDFDDDFIKKANADMATQQQKKDAALVENATKKAKTLEMLPSQWKLIISSVHTLTDGKAIGIGADHIHWTSERTAQAGNYIHLVLLSSYKRGIGDVYQANFKHGDTEHGDTNRLLDLNPSLKDDHIVWSIFGSHLPQSRDMTTEEVSESVAKELYDFYQRQLVDNS